MTQSPRPVFPTAASAMLLLALAAPAAASTVLPFNNTGAITINVQGNATPYPSNITVSGVPTNFTRLEVQLNGFTHSFPDDVDVLLVGPQGQRAILMSDAGGPRPGVGTGQTLTFAQTAANPIPDATAPASGLFRPANYIESAGSSPVDTFPTPGPGALTDAPADLFVFNSFNPNGVWSLFVVDDANGDFGSISGGWTLRFTAPTVFTVTITSDTNDGVCNADCSLREALALAQDGDLVNFSTLFNTPQTINLLTALPNINRSITIQGTGANLLTVRRDFNAATEFRIFTIAGGVTNGVAISGVTITGGNAGGNGFGGGIASQSTLTLTNVHVAGNTAGSGGGVSLRFANGVFTGCTFSGNTATNGGGIFYEGLTGQSLRIVNSTMGGNTTSNGPGGGIRNFSLNGNSTLEVTNSTIANNSGTLGVGGILTTAQGAGATATTTLRNTIVTGNSPNNLATQTFSGGVATFQTLGFNLSDNYNGVFTPIAGSDITSATPRLAPLALYGGQTPTHALLHGSPALNVGNASGQATDQRGQGRPGNGSSPNADIGAFEAQTPNVIIVNNINDSGAGSLRGAINTLLNVGDPDVYDIQFDSTFFSMPRTITLTSADLFINGNMTILAPGADLLTVSGGNHRVFRVNPGRTATLSGMTIAGGNSSGGSGGGISNTGDLTLSHAVVTGNQTSGNIGGGIFNNSRLNVFNSTISGNTGGAGGGIFNDGSGITTVTNSAVSGNTANFAVGTSGGIDSYGRLSVINSTISENNAPNGTINGGGIFSVDNTTITNSTITNNSAAGLTSASGVFRFSGTVNIRNSIVAGNVGNATQPDVVASGGTGITSNGFNLIGNRGTLTFGTTDQAGGGGNPILNPLLGPLQNNGGTTQTHFLFEGSPALDKGNSSGATSDQRGQLRPVDFVTVPNASDGADIGAFEALVAPFAPVPPTVTYNPSNASTIVFPSGAAGTAISSIAVSSSGGVAPGSVNVSSCAATGGFTIIDPPINLTGTAGGAQISGSILLSCTRGASLQTGTLSCSETPNPGSAVTRSWTLNCPVAAGDPIFGNGFEG